MGKIKIRKNLSDEEMLAGYKESLTFENIDRDDEVMTKPATKPGRKELPKEGNSAFFTPELQEQVGKALLELKVKLYHEGIVDYGFKVTREGNQVILTAIPSTV